MELTTEQLIKLLLGVIVVAAVIIALYFFSSNVNEFFISPFEKFIYIARKKVQCNDDCCNNNYSKKQFYQLFCCKFHYLNLIKFLTWSIKEIPRSFIIKI